MADAEGKEEKEKEKEKEKRKKKKKKRWPGSRKDRVSLPVSPPFGIRRETNDRPPHLPPPIKSKPPKKLVWSRQHIKYNPAPLLSLVN